MRPALTIIVPMPDFALRKMGQFETVDKDRISRLEKSVFERFPMNPPQLPYAPAFNTDWLKGLTPLPRSSITTLEHDYYEGVRENSLQKDLDERQIKRQEYLQFLNELYTRNQMALDLVKREHFFAALNKNRDRQHRIINESRAEASEQSLKNTEVRIDAFLLQTLRTEMRLFLKEQCPTKRLLKMLADNFGFEPSLSQKAILSYIQGQENRTQKTKQDIDTRRQLAMTLAKSIYGDLFSAERRDIEIQAKPEYSLNDLRHAQLGKEVNLEEMKKLLGDEHFKYELTQKSLQEAALNYNGPKLKDTTYHMRLSDLAQQTYLDDKSPPRRRK